MSNVIPLAHPATSAEVVEKLIELGYLKGTNRQSGSAVDDALARLREDLCRNQTIRTSITCYHSPLLRQLFFSGVG